MPLVINAGMDQADSAIRSFLNYLDIPFSTDYTCDSQGNITARYVYGTLPSNSIVKELYNKSYWYVVTTPSSQAFCYCDNITFHDDYDESGNFLGRNVTIEGGIVIFSFGLPANIIYSYNAGGIGFYYDRIIMDDSGSPYFYGLIGSFAGSGYYDGSANLITQKLRLTNFNGITDIDAYWGTLNDYEVVGIDNSYYFKIPYYNALFPGDGTEGTVKTLNVFVVPEDTASAMYISSSEIWEEVFMPGLPKLFKVKLELA
jgi:hypothetical protein